MNDHSKDSQTRYLREAGIVLAKEGFQLDEVHTDRLCILLDGAPLCEVTESGGIAYRNKDIDEPERIAAKDKVYEIVRNTAEYMRQMETAPVLKADGLEDGYKVLADFNGTVLAGVQSKYGVHFVTWDWAYGHTGVCHGHYFMENYAGAKQDFASADEQWRKLLDHLKGKEITSAGHLSAQNFSFGEEIIELDGKLNFYLQADFDVDAAFGTFVCTDQNDDWLNIYANYDVEQERLCDTLELNLCKGDGSEESWSYPLNAAEQEVLLRKMEAFCQQQTGMSLHEYARQLRDSEKQAPEMQM